MPGSKEIIYMQASMLYSAVDTWEEPAYGFEFGIVDQIQNMLGQRLIYLKTRKLGITYSKSPDEMKKIIWTEL